MNEQLQQIETELANAQSKFTNVKREIAELGANLAEQRKAHGAAIAEGQDAKGLGEEIAIMQTRLTGAEEARTQLLETLRDLQERKSNELRAIAIEQAETEKREILAIEADIYATIVQAAQRLPDLRNKRADYLAQLTAAGSREVRNEGQKITFLFELLRRELPNLLDNFPRSILADGTLPAPSSVRRQNNT